MVDRQAFDDLMQQLQAADNYTHVVTRINWFFMENCLNSKQSRLLAEALAHCAGPRQEERENIVAFPISRVRP